MSVTVDLEALRDRLAEYGDVAYLVTVSDQRTPKVASVELRYDDGLLRTTAGRGTRANLRDNPVMTLLWAPRLDPAYSMIIDAEAVTITDDGEITIRPTSGVLHRVAGAAGDGPTCLPVTGSPTEP